MKQLAIALSATPEDTQEDLGIKPVKRQNEDALTFLEIEKAKEILCIFKTGLDSFLKKNDIFLCEFDLSYERCQSSKSFMGFLTFIIRNNKELTKDIMEKAFESFIRNREKNILKQKDEIKNPRAYFMAVLSERGKHTNTYLLHYYISDYFYFIDKKPKNSQPITQQEYPKEWMEKFENVVGVLWDYKMKRECIQILNSVADFKFNDVFFHSGMGVCKFNATYKTEEERERTIKIIKEIKEKYKLPRVMLGNFEL